MATLKHLLKRVWAHLRACHHPEHVVIREKRFDPERHQWRWVFVCTKCDAVRPMYLYEGESNAWLS